MHPQIPMHGGSGIQLCSQRWPHISPGLQVGDGGPFVTCTEPGLPGGGGPGGGPGGGVGPPGVVGVGVGETGGKGPGE